MKNIWKWLFFILLALVIIAGIVMAINIYSMATYGGYASGTMMTPFGGRSFGFHDFDGMRGGYTSFPFFILPFMLLGFGFRLLPLIFFGLIVWGIYRLGVSAGRKQHATPTQPIPAPAVDNEQEVEMK